MGWMNDGSYNRQQKTGGSMDKMDKLGDGFLDKKQMLESPCPPLTEEGKRRAAANIAVAGRASSLELTDADIKVILEQMGLL